MSIIGVIVVRFSRALKNLEFQQVALKFWGKASEFALSMI